MVIFNVNHGPWLQGSFLHQKAEAAALWRRTILPEAVAEFADDICQEQMLGSASEESRECPERRARLVFDAVWSLDTFRNPGPLAPPASRWLRPTRQG